MLKEHSSFVKQTIACIDCVLIFFALNLAHLIVSSFTSLRPLAEYWFIYIGFLGFYLYFAWTRHLFSILQFGWQRGLFHRLGAIFATAGVLGAAILYTIPDPLNSRWLYFIFAALSFIFIAAEKLAVRAVITRIRRLNRNITPVILVGRGRLSSQIIKRIYSHPEWGLRITRIIDISVNPLEFEDVLKNHYVEEVFFCIPRSLTKGGFRIDPYLQICEEMGRSARVFLNMPAATSFARWEFHRFLDQPTLVSHTVELDPDQLLFKRAFDIVGAVAGMAVFFLSYPFLALAIKLSSPGPVFFRQIRVGKNGKRFVIYKYRTMYADAEYRKKELYAHNELKGAMFKIRNDPRITPVGRVIRRLSLDELPQFLNVLKGEMSLVGTRPPTPDEVAQYSKWHHRRISIRPGITGLWQVSGRNQIRDFDEIVRLDLKYIDSWSLWLDMKILFQTLLVLLKRDTAF